MAKSRKIVIIAHNLRSSLNVGALLRTADGLGIDHVYLTGYTSYPLREGDNRLPHLARKIHTRINKTALGAETRDFWSYEAEVLPLIDRLQADGYQIAALEQAAGSIMLPTFQPPAAMAIILGREVEGIEPEILATADTILEIPMSGLKESLNVVQAAAMAMYHCRFHT